ncbi:hypothetical protein [Lactobacillus sp.]|uniref:hypothetical protein n=1 Tax=Lactobacillus sp. TaxID=1591 RepID=UPI0025FCCCC6|nr:hypothetical protein [Lactobacillus sp.]MCO6532400.1 hypothetical protein [Lactobacillus sp.]
MSCRKYEYSMIPKDEYEILFDEADIIISNTAVKYKINKWDVRYDNSINFLLSTTPDLNSFCYSTKSNPTSLYMFNTLLSEDCRINIQCQNNLLESEPFINIIGGFTLFTEIGPVLLLNSDPSQVSQHVIFTIAHELIHIYKAESDDTYCQAAALINKNKAIGSAYPPELQPVEDQTNVLASLIYAPNSSLNYEIMYKSFDELCILYNMSKSAMHNRLRNYFYYERGFDFYAAKNAVFSFRNSNLKEISQIRESIENSCPNLISLPF